MKMVNMTVQIDKTKALQIVLSVIIRNIKCWEEKLVLDGQKYIMDTRYLFFDFSILSLHTIYRCQFVMPLRVGLRKASKQRADS